MTRSPCPPPRRSGCRHDAEAFEERDAWQGTAHALIDAGKLKPVVNRTYPLTETAEGLRRVEAGHVPGKLVVAVA